MKFSVVFAILLAALSTDALAARQAPEWCAQYFLDL
jgi:hypothetical protein